MNSTAAHLQRRARHLPGIPVLWLDKESEVSIAKVRSTNEKLILAIDDADLYGPELIGLLRDLVPGSKQFLFVLAIRSGKVDETTSVLQASGDVVVYEHVVPPLTDEDIDSLIATLERNSRLGILTGEGPETRRRAFREQAGRQMLVAMIQATSSEKLEEKAHNELTQLAGAQRYVYALVSVASSLRHFLTKDEILLACSDLSGDALSALDRLAVRHLVSERLPAYWYRARHRVIADLGFDKLVELKELKDALLGLAWALASKANPSLERHSRIFKFLASIINHAFLRQLIGVMAARDIYNDLETILSWNYHYWLQRGSLEVEAGDIKLAENFLSAAHSLGSEDYRVRTAYAYMLMRKAYDSVGGTYSGLLTRFSVP